MKEVIVVCEGTTEEVFINEILVPALGNGNFFLSPRLIATSRHSKGGSLKGQRVLRFLRNTLRERRNTYVTTFFDLYGLPPDFPGRTESTPESDPLDRAKAIEAKFHAAVVDAAECRPDRFLPHVQPHEFEALLFSDPKRFAEVEPAWQRYMGRLESVRQSVHSPEHINDGVETYPSARLRNLLRPRYNKVRHGRAVSARVGVDRMRAACRHFDEWLARVEALPPFPSGD